MITHIYNRSEKTNKKKKRKKTLKKKKKEKDIEGGNGRMVGEIHVV